MKKTLLISLTKVFAFPLIFLPVFIGNSSSFPEQWQQKGEVLYLHTDRTRYALDERLWYRAYLLDENLQKQSPSDIIHVKLFAPDGSEISHQELIALDGMASGDIDLSGLHGGIYTLQASTQWLENFGEEYFFKKEIEIFEASTPLLRMKLDFLREAYGPADEVEAIATFETLENKPLANTVLNFTVSLEAETWKEGIVTTDAEGKALIRFSLPETLTKADGRLTVQTDATGVPASITRTIPIVLGDIDLQFFPEGGDWIAEHPTNMAFKALNAQGKPADVEGVIVDKDGQTVQSFKSFHDGMGAVALTAEQGNYYVARITRPQGVQKTYALPKPQSAGISLAVQQQEDALQISLFSTQEQAAKISLFQMNRLHTMQPVCLTAGENRFSFSTQDFPMGVVRVLVADAQDRPLAERLVFAHPTQHVTFDIQPDKAQYLPRETITLHIESKDARGKGVPATFSLAVADDAWLSHTDDKQPHILTHFLLSAGLKGNIHEPNFYFDPKEEKAEKALDYVMMTHGWRRFAYPVSLTSKPPQQAVIRGKVEMGNRQEKAGVRVYVAGTDIYAETNQEGRFELHDINLVQPLLLTAEVDGFQQSVRVAEYEREYVLERKIRGKVVDGQGFELPGCPILWKGTEKGTTTGIDGNFELNIYQANLTGKEALQVSYIGFKSVEILLNEIPNPTKLLIQLEPDTEELQEIAVEGLSGRVSGVNTRRSNRRSRRNNAVEEMIEIPPTEQRPPPPIIQQPELIEIPDASEIEEEIEIDLDMEVNEESIVEEVIMLNEESVSEAEPEEEVEQIFEIVEESAEPKGGYPKLYRFIKKHLVYPAALRRMGVEGKVFIQFVVEKDGSLQNAKVLRGIHPQADQAAVRALMASTEWKPGKQRGRAVAQRFVLPIVFSLDNYDPEAAQNLMRLEKYPQLNRDYPQRGKYHVAREFYVPRYTSKEIPEVRTDFRKTIYWNPNVITDEMGKATVQFPASDALTTFRATAEGIGQDAPLGRGESTFFITTPIAIQTRIPSYFSGGDRVEIPITLTNRSEKPWKGKLSLHPPNALQPLFGQQAQTITLAPGQMEVMYFPYQVADFSGKQTLHIRLEGKGVKETIQRTLRIEQKGFPMSYALSGTGNARTSLALDQVVPNSLKASFEVYPDMLGTLLSGLESMLREPLGCFEQTSSSTYPNILVLNLLKQTNRDAPAIQQKALQLIDKGYKRLIGFETSEHGFEWFGKAPANLSLTAYGLQEFTDMQQVYPHVDPEMLDRTRQFLLNKRDGKGGYSNENRTAYRWQCDPAIANAYVTYALVMSGEKGLEKEIEQLYEDANASKDPYRLALAISVLQRMGNGEKAQSLTNLILTLQEKAGNWTGNIHSITHSQGKSLAVETTSLAVLALLESGKPRFPTIRKGVEFILKNRSTYGGFGSTQATVLALKALAAYIARYPLGNEKAGLTLLVAGKEAAQLSVSPGQQKTQAQKGLAPFFATGNQAIQVSTEQETTIPYTLALNWKTYQPPSSPECQVQLHTQLPKKEVKVGESVRMNATVKNLSNASLPMALAKIGIPAGLQLQPKQVKALQEKGLFDYFELEDTYLVLYWCGMSPLAQLAIPLDLETVSPGAFSAPASQAYLYYHDEHRHWVAGEHIEIKP